MWSALLPSIYFILFSFFNTSSAIRRDFYISAEEHWWDYAPSKQNLVTNDARISDLFIQNREDRIGSVHRKVMYNLYTDGTFSRQIKSDPWMGYIGPLLKGETGDVMYVHFRNMASRPFALHPHGVMYFKDSEGALYADGTQGQDKLDDAVPPGKVYTYKWFLTKSFAPTPDGDNCTPHGYHPHIRSNKDVDTGLVGLLLVCKPGTLRPDGSRKDVDREFVLYADITNETNSWLIEESLNKCGNPARCKQLFEEKDPAFVNGNLYHHINGFVYGNQPDFPVFEGELVVFYSFGLNLGLHTVAIQGQTFTVNKRRVHTHPVGIAMFEGLYWTPRNPGRWLMWCKLAYHFNHGMATFVNIMPSRWPIRPSMIGPRRTRRYFLAAEEVVWDYIPSGRVLARVGKGSESRSRAEERFLKSNGAVGGRFVKAVFRQYTDGTFKSPKIRGPDERHLGILGPSIKVEVGEILEIIFMNKASRSYSFNPYGVAFTKDNEGAFYKNNKSSDIMSGKIARPGEIQRYIFTVPEDYSPTDLDPQCITYGYQSFVDYSRDMYSGLVGPLLVCKPGVLDEHGRQRNIDREFYLMFMTWFEKDGWYFNESIALAKENGKTVKRADALSTDANNLRAINGRSYGNIDGFEMCIGDRVSWHAIGFGERFDSHSAMFEGNNVQLNGRNKNFIFLIAGTYKTAYMIPDNPGRWLLNDGQLGSQTDGSVISYDVYTCERQQLPFIPFTQKLVVRRMYIAAVEIMWDYAPNKINPLTLTDLRDPQTPGHLYVRDDDGFIGTIYKKAVYREFTDCTFTVEVPRKKDDLHLGLLGPYIRAEVGDIIEIVYKNMASFDNSISLNNLLADNDMTYQQSKIGVKPGETQTYRWIVPERSGPGKNEPNCVGYQYGSAVFPKQDTATGLHGPLIICRQGILDAFGRRNDYINKEFVLAFVIFNEGNSFYFTENVKRKAPNRTDLNDGLFREANVKYTMNGYIFNNLPNLVMNEGDNVAWYSHSYGSFLGVHSNHFHGLTFVRSTKLALRNDVLWIQPGTSETVEMYANNPGSWIVHCHVGIHMANGMEALYTVLPRKHLGQEQK